MEAMSDEGVGLGRGLDLLELDLAVIGMLWHLPAAGADWTSEERQAWLKAFNAVMDMTHPESKAGVNAEVLSLLKHG